MRRLAALYLALDATPATGRKRALIAETLADAPPEEAAWMLWLLMGERLKRTLGRGELLLALSEATGLPSSVIEAAHAQVGDLAETAALLFDDPPRPAADRPLAAWIAEVKGLPALPPEARRAWLVSHWRSLPFAERFLLTKLLTGALRVGVSRGLAARALADVSGLDVATVLARLTGPWQPSAESWQRLLAARSGGPEPAQPYPFALAQPLQGDPSALGPVSAFLAEWKWDGIRAQLIRRAGACHLVSRGEESLTGRFPEIEAQAARLPDGTVLDGEILAWNESGIQPFALLQRRIGRKKPGARTLREAPVRFMAYDLLEHRGEDWRSRPLSARRAALEALAAEAGFTLSQAVTAPDWASLDALRRSARERCAEGLMLKRWDAPYPLGRTGGAWWKWKLDPFTVDAVLIYAQAGHGRRAGLYTDYTFAVWHEGALVPIAKAYSGLNDEEIVALDRWIRRHTRERFGPVRSVEPELVFELAFEGIQASPRHKSGVALRFPRIHRWRRDKTAAQADALAALHRMLGP